MPRRHADDKTFASSGFHIFQGLAQEVKVLGGVPHAVGGVLDVRGKIKGQQEFLLRTQFL